MPPPPLGNWYSPSVKPWQVKRQLTNSWQILTVSLLCASSLPGAVGTRVKRTEPALTSQGRYRVLTGRVKSVECEFRGPWLLISGALPGSFLHHQPVVFFVPVFFPLPIYLFFTSCLSQDVSTRKAGAMPGSFTTTSQCLQPISPTARRVREPKSEWRNNPHTAQFTESP